MLLLLLSFSLGAEGEEETCDATKGGLWSNFVGNLDQLFWTPFLQRFSAVRYTMKEHPLLPSTSTLQKTPKSCREMGISRLLDVLCIQATAQLGWKRPCTMWARPALVRSMDTLLECPQQTWANNEAVFTTLNHTLQRRQHCEYATRAMQCSLLHFHWVVPQVMATLAVAVVVAAVLLGCCCCCCCCFGKKEQE
jgi:hypothetical protein